MSAEPKTGIGALAAEWHNAEVDRLRAQCQRDFALAEEWKARYEAQRVELEETKTRLERVAKESLKKSALLDAERRTRDAALARAEAAERNSLKEAGEVIRLEDELARRNAAYDELEGIRRETAARLDRAESECAALRAEVERLQSRGRDQDAFIRERNCQRPAANEDT